MELFLILFCVRDLPKISFYSPVVVVVGKALNEEEEKELEDVMKASEQIMTLDQFVDKYGGEDETQDQVETRDPDEICLVTW